MKRRQEEGFALIVVAALFLAFATLAAAMIDRSNATKLMQAQVSTQEKLSRISMAMVQYYLFNGSRYPCPAPWNVAHNASNFGLSVACVSSSPPGITVFPGASVVMGTIPVAALAPYGIAHNDAFDAWNNRIMYAVDRNMATGGGGTASVPRISITDRYTNQTYRSPDFLLISYGRDGIGAIPLNMTSISIPCTVDGAPRHINCAPNLNFIKGPALVGPNATALNYFDDILSFYGR